MTHEGEMNAILFLSMALAAAIVYIIHLSSRNTKLANFVDELLDEENREAVNPIHVYVYWMNWYRKAYLKVVDLEYAITRLIHEWGADSDCAISKPRYTARDEYMKVLEKNGCYENIFVNLPKLDRNTLIDNRDALKKELQRISKVGTV